MSLPEMGEYRDSPEPYSHAQRRLLVAVNTPLSFVDGRIPELDPRRSITNMVAQYGGDANHAATVMDIAQIYTLTPAEIALWQVSPFSNRRDWMQELFKNNDQTRRHNRTSLYSKLPYFSNECANLSALTYYALEDQIVPPYLRSLLADKTDAFEEYYMRQKNPYFLPMMFEFAQGASLEDVYQKYRDLGGFSSPVSLRTMLNRTYVGTGIGDKVELSAVAYEYFSGQGHFS